MARNKPLLVGSTGDIYDGFITFPTQKDRNTAGSTSASSTNTESESNYFRSAQWSPDGTTLLTCSADNTLRTFILYCSARPPDLLSSLSPHTLQPYASHILPSPPYATAIHPAYSLSAPSTCLYLASLPSLPIRLLSPFAPGLLASYPLTNPTTEAFIAPNALLFDAHGPNGNCFFAGSNSEISLFDINRDGQSPLSRMKTIPSRRKKMVGGGVGMKGVVSALGMSCEGILAAGTFTRWVGLYDGAGRGGAMGVFEIRSEEEDDPFGDTAGAGITQVLWSSCGRYLCIVERGSEGTGVWDVRGSGKRLSWLKGREAMTMQRLGAEVVGTDMWAGGMDGIVRVWEGLGITEGIVEPVWQFKAHNDAVSSAVTHPSGTVLATCSGQRHEFDEEDEVTHLDSSDVSDNSQPPSSSAMCSLPGKPYDNSLKIWAM